MIGTYIHKIVCMRFPITVFILCLIIQAILSTGICSAQEETPEVEIRLANGVPVEGTFLSAAPEGLAVQSVKGTKTLPWKYLSAGTRWRYERPMLAELEAKRIKAKAKAAAAAAANKSVTTASSSPVPVITNKPATK